MPLERAAFDPAGVTLRHIVRATSATPGAVQVAGAWFAPVVNAGDIYDGMNGRHGFVSCPHEPQQGEDGTVTIVFPNAVGADGALHRDRFALTRQGADYRIGEEWIEIYVAGRLKMVMTPQDYEITITQVTITGPDAGKILDRSRAGLLERWNHAPRDAMDHYAGANTPVEVAEFSLGSGEPDIDFSNGITTTTDGRFKVRGAQTDLNPPSSFPRAVTFLGVTGGVQSFLAATSSLDVTDPGKSWRVRAVLSPATRLQANTSPDPGAGTTLFSAYNHGTPDVFKFTIECCGATVEVTPANHVAFHINSQQSIEVVGFDGWVMFYVQGELVAVLPLLPAYLGTYYAMATVPPSTAGVLRQLDVRQRRPLLGQDEYDGDELLVPGAPVPGGLRGRYYDEAGTKPNVIAGSLPARSWFLAPTAEPVASRLDPTIDFAWADPPGWQPGAVGTQNFSARWTGSIYLDLTGNGRKIRVTADDDGIVWIGRTMPDQAVAAASVNTSTSGNLKDVLGAVKGWFPIVIEYTQGPTIAANAAGIILESSPLDGSGNPTGWAVVPASQLSPNGIYENLIRLEKHRDTLGAIAESFGYQWRTEPRQLESGEFPGRLVPRIRIGRDTELVLDEADCTGIKASGSVADTVDTLTADAAGIVTTDESTQLTAHVTAADAARSHAFEHADYVSLADISEAGFLAQRLRTMMLLRSEAFEQVTADSVPGARQPVDTFPPTDARQMMDFEPGDGVRLNWPSVNIVDQTPRQITATGWAARPAGRSRPRPTFRSRVRSLAQLIKRIQRDAVVSQRNQQDNVRF